MPIGFRNKERDESIEETGYRNGWKDGYEVGYMAAWKEIEEQDEADKEEANAA